MANTSGPRPSLALIAEMLGVSRTTVSNAYNRPEQLSRSLRERILSTAEQIGYSGPDPTARSLRTKRVGAIGVLFTDRLSYAFEDQASVDFLAGMAIASTGTQMSLSLMPAGATQSSIEQARQLVNRAVVDGFVVYSVAAGDPYLEAALARGLPTVICDQPADDVRAPFVGIDDYEAIAPAAQALIDAGHRQIGILCIRLDPTPNNGAVTPSRLQRARHHVQRARVQGALRVLADAGIAPKDVPIVERHLNEPATNIDAARELLTTYPELTAVLCTTDTMAFGVLEYAKSAGLRVPEDVSVTGFDGVERALNCGLSTVIQPNKEKGQRAALALQELIEDPRKEVSQEILATKFFEGNTVGTPVPQVPQSG